MVIRSARDRSIILPQSSPYVVMDDPATSIFVLARNVEGRWLLREGLGETKESFVSFEAALAFVNSPAMRRYEATVAISCGAQRPSSMDEVRK